MNMKNVFFVGFYNFLKELNLGMSKNFVRILNVEMTKIQFFD